MFLLQWYQYNENHSYVKLINTERKHCNKFIAFTMHVNELYEENQHSYAYERL